MLCACYILILSCHGTEVYRTHIWIYVCIVYTHYKNRMVLFSLQKLMRLHCMFWMENLINRTVTSHSLNSMRNENRINISIFFLVDEIIIILCATWSVGWSFHILYGVKYSIVDKMVIYSWMQSIKKITTTKPDENERYRTV